MVGFLLTLHNIFRWVVLILALIAIVRAFVGWLQRREWVRADDRAGLFYTMFLDIQVLLGIILYIYPGTYTRILLQNPGTAMGDRVTRFFAVEHILMMLIALAIAHVGRAMSKRAPVDISKHRRAAIWFTVSLLVILASIPWPFMEGIARPLLRFFGLL